MEIDDAKREVARLTVELEKHTRLYYVDAAPVISDLEFDQMLKELEALEAAFPTLGSPNSPTQRVGGAPLEGFVQVEHARRMMSLDNTYNEEELTQWYERAQKGLNKKEIPLVIEPKVDGVAVSITYKEGQFVLAATRGDGRTGDDISQNVRTIRSLPLQLPKDGPQTFEIRGEIYMPNDGFATMNAEREAAGEKTFVNPRNATAGTLKQLDPTVAAKRPLDVILHGFGSWDDGELIYQNEFYELLDKVGLRKADHIWKVNTVEEMLAAVRELDKLRHQLPYETDGAVMKIDSIADQKKLGETSKAPRWAISFKYQAEQAETKLHNISIQIGRTGALTPVANLEPVFVSGSTVSRATLHNEEEIERKDIREGDTVIIEKAGEIIPAVVKVRKELRTGDEKVFKMPTECPYCDTPVERAPDQVAVRCGNPNCPEQVKRRLQHFAARGAMDISGLGESLVEQLVDSELAGTFSDLYDLTESGLLSLERMGVKSAQNLLVALENSKTQDAWRLVFGLGILHVGASSARSLIDHYKSIDAVKKATLASLETVDDVGEIVARSIHDYFRDPQNTNEIELLRAAGLTFSQAEPDPETAGETSDKFEDTTWVITGTLSESRNYYADKIRANSGKVTGSVSKNTTYLLAGEKAGSKLKKAESLGVEVLDEASFNEMLES